MLDVLESTRLGAFCGRLRWRIVDTSGRMKQYEAVLFHIHWRLCLDEERQGGVQNKNIFSAFNFSDYRRLIDEEVKSV